MRKQAVMFEADQYKRTLHTEPQAVSEPPYSRSLKGTSVVPWISHATGRIRCIWLQRGAWGTIRFVLSRIYRRQSSLVFGADLEKPRPPASWDANEQVLQIGPENVDSEMTPELERFLGGEAIDNIEGLHNGDRLFVVVSGGQYLHRGYILFNTREKKLIGEVHDAPMIGCCMTSPAARGRGLYRKALIEEMNYLHRQGYRRVTIETSPDNLASRKGIEAAGFSYAWEARIWILLNLLIVRCIRTQTGNQWRAFLL